MSKPKVSLYFSDSVLEAYRLQAIREKTTDSALVEKAVQLYLDSVASGGSVALATQQPSKESMDSASEIPEADIELLARAHRIIASDPQRREWREAVLGLARHSLRSILEDEKPGGEGSRAKPNKKAR